MKIFSSILPSLALVWAPVLMEEVKSHWPEFYDPPIFAGQIEQETCPSLTSKKCWNPNAELKTSREYGFGLGQITIAYNADGTERFNTFTEVKRLDSTLKMWDWKDRYNGQFQLRAFLLKNKVNWNKIEAADDEQHMKFMEYAYNGGLGSVYKDQRLCKETKNCNPLIWDGNVEVTSTKSKKSFGGVYGDQSPHSITRHYVKQVPIRAEKYRDFLSQYGYGTE